ncbi:03264955-a32d-4e60-a34c-0b2bbd743d1b [Sclerotinia trifoliorum]|uniref:03264955-a32d-4e60-a34c-0b2bbd743d1b n=1 Tax=Sclerotinia trifoliorum TaxID=28548 RepID=A0A8H2ZL16_9HELO|nr:03264955-a32d-4e60-a34c-0b2bbd743d1b [Sclerotinia trifoliorum]
MAPNIREFISDGFEALKLVARLSWRRNLKAWIQVPFGIVLILLACFGVNALIGLSSVSFPASVACLILLFFILNIIDLLIGHQRTRALVSVIDIPSGWALRYINVFFTPSFVLLPLSDSITAAEVGKIIGVFLIGFLVMFAVTAWLVRGLQILLGSSKRAIIERAEEMGAENDAIPLAVSSNTNFTSTDTRPKRFSGDRKSTPEPVSDTVAVEQEPLPLTRAQIWAAFINRNLDILTYGVIFLFIGIPVYYATGYAMPVQLTFNILAYFAAQSLSVRWKQFLHPVLLSSGITIIGIWILGLIRGNNLDEVLGAYRTNTKYIAYWDGERNLPLPGAGDMFNSVLDASIVSLALPMFQYRHELKNSLHPHYNSKCCSSHRFTFWLPTSLLFYRHIPSNFSFLLRAFSNACARYPRRQ